MRNDMGELWSIKLDLKIVLETGIFLTKSNDAHLEKKDHVDARNKTWEIGLERQY